jgi:glycosyltransferase involved in cell wall biosynthesis
MISAVVLTKNEEKNIVPCLRSLAWCDEIIIVDDYSEDETVKKSQISNLKSQNQNLKLKIYKRQLNNDFASQRNFGLKKAKGDWVLFLDADERVSHALRAEIFNFQFSIFKNYNGFYLRRKDWFGRRWLKYGETANVKLLRLAKKDAGSWKRKVHEVWEVKGEIGELKNPILHYPHPTISDFLKQINFYSTLHAQALWEEKVRPSLWRIIFYPLGKFFQNYIWRRGFLDGMPGLIVALMMSFHSFLAQSKLYLEWKK